MGKLRISIKWNPFASHYQKVCLPGPATHIHRRQVVGIQRFPQVREFDKSQEVSQAQGSPNKRNAGPPRQPSWFITTISLGFIWVHGSCNLTIVKWVCKPNSTKGPHIVKHEKLAELEQFNKLKISAFSSMSGLIFRRTICRDGLGPNGNEEKELLASRPQCFYVYVFMYLLK